MERSSLNLTKAVKYDENKTDWLILPIGSMKEIIKALQYGENKYSRGNFAVNPGLEYCRLLNSLLRHTFSFANPLEDDLDEESNLHHLAHAGANVVMLLHYTTNPQTFKENDDRTKKVLP